MDGADGEACTGNTVGNAWVDCTAGCRKSFIRDLYLVTSLMLKIPIFADALPLLTQLAQLGVVLAILRKPV